MRARLRIAAVLAIAVFSYPVVNHAGSGAPKEKPSKLDRVLRKAADHGDTSDQRVIVRTRRGQTSTVANRLRKHGDRVESEHRATIISGEAIRSVSHLVLAPL